MRNPLTSLILIIFFSLSLSYCHKNKLPAAVLPEATQEGKNTVGFTLNGEVWVPYYKCCWSCDPCGEFSADYGPPMLLQTQLILDLPDSKMTSVQI